MADTSDDAARWEALARYLAGEAQPAEAARLERWIAEAPERRALVASLDAMMNGLRAGPAADIDTAAALQNLHERMGGEDIVRLAPGHEAAPERAPDRRRMSLFRIAATVLLLIVAGLVWRSTGRPGEAPPTTQAAAAVWSTDAGRTESLRLPDGTTVLLGPLSTVSMVEGYGSGSRIVELTGEALFDVADGPDGPFTVRAGGGIVQDLGTTFTVRTVDTDEVRVVVTAGTVRLQAAGAPEHAGVVLEAGDRGILSGTAVRAEPASAGASDLAWTEGRLVFEDAPFERVRIELRRWYGIELRVDDPALRTPPLTTTFEDAARGEVLDVLALVYGATIEQRGDTAILRGTPNR